MQPQPRTFTDAAGRTWTVAINIGAIRRVQKLAEVELGWPELKLLHAVCTNTMLLSDIMYALCKPEADKLGLSQEDFDKGMTGDAIEQAETAFWEAYGDFLPSAKRAALKIMVDKVHKLFEDAGNAAIQRLEALDVNKIVDDAFREKDESHG